jgi:hypothetical protein
VRPTGLQLPPTGYRHRLSPGSNLWRTVAPSLMLCYSERKLRHTRSGRRGRRIWNHEKTSHCEGSLRPSPQQQLMGGLPEIRSQFSSYVLYGAFWARFSRRGANVAENLSQVGNLYEKIARHAQPHTNHISIFAELAMLGDNVSNLCHLARRG